MSNKNEYVASLNRLEKLIDSNQTELKRDVESLIDRRFGSLKREVISLKSCHSPLDQITNQRALLVEQGKDDRCDLSDLSSHIGDIHSTITSNNHETTSAHELDSSEIDASVTVEPANGNELDTEEQVNGIDTNVPSTSTTNDANVNETTGPNEQVNRDTLNLSSVSTSTNDTEHDQSTNGTLLQKSNETTRSMLWDSYMEVYLEDEDDYNQGGEEQGDNQNETLHEESNGTNQNSENEQPIIDQQVNNESHESNEPILTTTDHHHNESQTSRLSSGDRRKTAGQQDSGRHANSSSIYTCQIANCGKTFNKKYNFEVHQRTHIGVKPHHCELIDCGMSFALKWDLDKHQLKHQGVKLYKCTWNKLCGYVSTRSADVIRHICIKHFRLPAGKK